VARGSRNEDTDPSIRLPDFDDIIIEIDENDIDVIELTTVREAPRRPT
jgi:hypothetical protein